MASKSSGHLTFQGIARQPSSGQNATSMTDRQAQLIHFPWLTELRFFAALAVVTCHVAQIRQWEGIGPHASGWIHCIGSHGVRVFFVLSGFLITHLLLSERQRTGTIDIKKFYVRRALRIWPLYYALLVVAFAVPASLLVIKGGSQLSVLCDMRYHDLFQKVPLFLFMLPNVAALMFPPLVGAAQTWSVGVEEQFYILWPFLVKRFEHHPLKALLAVIASKLSVVSLVSFLLSSSIIAASSKPGLQQFAMFLSFLEIESMAVGGVAAYLLMHHPKVLNKATQNWPVRLVLLGAVPLLFTQHFVLPHEILICDVVYATMLVAFTLSAWRLPRMISSPLAYFGKISYGMYMVHPLVIMFSARMLFAMHLPVDSQTVVVLLYALSIAFTVGGAALCYELFEKRFLKLKSQYAVVQSSS
jgi:peptidoglycan/LPS O-acetylase OafA/YrhL